MLHGNVEVGSISRKELEDLKVGKFKLPLEREYSWKPINAETLFKQLRKDQHKDWIDDEPATPKAEPKPSESKPSTSREELVNEIFNAIKLEALSRHIRY